MLLVTMKPLPSSAVFKQLLLPLLLLLNIASGNAYECPLPECDFCLPDAVRQAPGVGFELTTSYATASVHHYNGLKIDLAFVPASPTYVELFTRLSLSTAPPKPSKLRKYLRRLNKRLGRPATADVGTISALISSLRGEVETRLNQKLDRVVVTTPQFPGFTREDLEDAIENAGLKSWLEYPLPYPTMLYAPNAAFAANGRGLCEESGNIYACLEEAEDGDIPSEQVFAVTFTNATLHTAVSRINYAFMRSQDTHIATPHLGLSMLPTYSSQSAYWVDVHDHLQSLPSAVAERGRPITTVVLLGENAGMPEFLTVLRDALSGVGVKTRTTMWDEDRDGEKQVSADGERRKMVRARLEAVADPRWAAARGAAHYARLRQKVPWNCTEQTECRKYTEAGASEGVQQVVLGGDEL